MANIYQKINEVMKNIEYLTKDDKVEFGTTKYKAISEEKVTTAVREQLVKQGIVIVTVEQESENKELIRTDKSVNMLTTVHVRYRIQNIDDVNDFVEVESNGTGVDTQDKGVGKAMTYAYKYMLLRTFAIPTGEDPDKISSAETDKKVENEVNNTTINKTKLDALNNSIENHNSERFKPLTKELLTQNIEKIIEGIRQGKKREELTPLIDNGINYTERDSKDSKTSQFNMNEDEIKTQEIEEKIAQKSGKGIEDVRKEYDRIIKTSNVNKDGKELYILRKITSKEFLKGHYTNKGRYSIYTREGLYSGFIDVTISNSNKANKAEIEYKSVPEQRNKGNMTISLEEVLSDIFIDNSFDNLTVRDIFPKTKIGEVFLAINSDNYASQAVANKIGFQQNGTIYKMTKEQFLQRVQGKKFTEQEIGKATIDRETTKKDKAQSQEKQDEQEILKTKEDESQLD